MPLCEEQPTQDFVRKTNKVPNAQNLTCSGPKKEHGGEKVFQYRRDTFYCDHRENLIIAFSVFGGFIATLLVALPCYKYRWYLTHARTVFTALVSRIREIRFHYNVNTMQLLSTTPSRKWIATLWPISWANQSRKNLVQKTMKRFVILCLVYKSYHLLLTYCFCILS